MRPSFSSGPSQSRILWIVLVSGMVAGAVAAKSHATPPAVSLSTANMAAVTPATSELGSEELTPVIPPADTATAVSGDDALILRSEPEMPVESIGQAVPGPSLGWPALLFLGLIVGMGAYLIVSRSKFGAQEGSGRNLEVLDTLRLGGRWQVSLVSAPGRLLVLGASSQEVTLLAELPLEPESDGETETPIVMPQPEITVKQDDAEDDPFLNDLLSRLSSTPSTVVRTSTPADEKALLRRRLQSMQRGPTQL